MVAPTAGWDGVGVIRGLHQPLTATPTTTEPQWLRRLNQTATSAQAPAQARQQVWRLRGATFVDAGIRWQPTIPVQGPLCPPAWWLAQTHGFLVDDQADQPVGVVEEVHVDDTKRPCALVAVQGWGRRWLVISIDAVTQIAPAERRLTVARPPTPDPRWRSGDHRPAWLSRRLRGVLRVLRRLALWRG
jgi:hypothetical protein